MNQDINTNSFDFLRIFFAFIVFFAHLGILVPEGYFENFNTIFNATLAINGFFVISGFLVSKSYSKSKSLTSYFSKRIRRVFPAYLVIIIVCATSFVFISRLSPQEYFTSGQFFKYLIANFSFQNYIEPCLPGVFENNYNCAVNGSLWTIKIEEGFYIILPFIIFISRKYIPFTLWCLIIYLCSIAFIFAMTELNYLRLAKQLPGAMAYLVIGVFFFKYFKFFILYKHYLILFALPIFVFEEYLFDGATILLPIAFGIMVLYLAYSTPLLNHFGKYGDFTYGIYIFHYPMIQLAVFYNLFNLFNPYLVALILTVLLAVFAILSWRYIETPFLDSSRLARYKKW